VVGRLTTSGGRSLLGSWVNLLRALAGPATVPSMSKLNGRELLIVEDEPPHSNGNRPSLSEGWGLHHHRQHAENSRQIGSSTKDGPGSSGSECLAVHDPVERARLE
jgi:hypothetical protein